jgi:hypothetical protein
MVRTRSHNGEQAAVETSAKYPVVVRRAGATAVALFAAVFWAPRIGEPDRTEAGAIAAVRAIISAELAYASFNNGYFDTLHCLESGSCAPRQLPRGPFLEPHFSTRERRGYRVEFHAGPKPESPRDRVSPSAMTGFAVVAIPSNPQLQHRSFCGDNRGTIYLVGSGAMPLVESGRCVDTRQSVANLRSAGR